MSQQVVNVTPEMIVTEWSEGCACGGTFLGHFEEPCREDCTGTYPVKWHHRSPSHPAVPRDWEPVQRPQRLSGRLVDLPDNVCTRRHGECGCERTHIG